MVSRQLSAFETPRNPSSFVLRASSFPFILHPSSFILPMPPSPSPDTCWLYLIRHAATPNNRARPPRLQGRRTDIVPATLLGGIASHRGLFAATRAGRVVAPPYPGVAPSGARADAGPLRRRSGCCPGRCATESSDIRTEESGFCQGGASRSPTVLAST